MDERGLIVVAVGGNALATSRSNPGGGAVDVLGSVAESVAVLARQHPVLVTHGNGPQVGTLAEDAERGGHNPGLDVLDAETQGQIGYLLARELRSAGVTRPVAAVLTQVVVDLDDPAFDNPTKPVGPVVGAEVAAAAGHRYAETTRGWRRVVASPEPVEVLELDAIRLLVDAGAVVVCAGGGGIPVHRTTAGRLSGVDAVIDKDLTAALLACELDAARLVILTDVDAVHRDWGTDASAPIERVDPDALRRWRFEPGSMGPKVEAACRFAEHGGVAVIGAIDRALEVAAGRSGTVVAAPGAGTPR